ncbi:hypothetical protein LI142_15130 [Eubacterium limosum]|uniref:Uncharacterized protein n=1 Tax=Eubacterium limosum TaxID=1736 RepID=A0ABT5USJ0_EUBLI|nr:hypothetical protein [Eubacterium limosum]MCB6570838.1 hypothetical protein [Eubacterium limosum]MDE1471930.1 hypothetical protein [Eubacterium limosum]
MNGLIKQIIINREIEQVDEARGNAEHGQLLDPIAYGTLFGKVAMLKRLELITEAEGIKLLNDVNFAYTGNREGESL